MEGMARHRRTERLLSDAFREAYQGAGLSQDQIAEAVGVDQPRVSKWARGISEPPLDVLPVIDELCGQPKGHVLELAGYVDRAEAGGVLAAIERDPGLHDPVDKDVMREAYRRFSKRTALEAVAPPSPTERPALEDWLAEDPHLTDYQRGVIHATYETYVRRSEEEARKTG